MTMVSAMNIGMTLAVAWGITACAIAVQQFKLAAPVRLASGRNFALQGDVCVLLMAQAMATFSDKAPDGSCLPVR